MAAFPCYTCIVLLWLLLCTPIMLNSVTCNTKTHCNKQDMSALLNFKQAVADPSGFLSSWSPQNDCCQWTGAHCHNITGRVTELSLPCHPILRAYGDLYDKSRCLTGNNKLSGEVPLSLRNCKKLWLLNLAGNKFSGVIPNWMGPNVKALQLRSNEFSGNISTAICQLDSLKVLDFANNRLTGSIPNCLHNMTSMMSENASLDKFSIYINILNQSRWYDFDLTLHTKGMELRYFKSMYAIDLSSNSLSGAMPLELFMLTRLQSLNLSHNHLVGIIPQEVGNLRQLEFLDLSCNRLSGQIPQFISGMSFLEDLNLSFNNFMGEIPSGTQLQGFTNLSYMGNPELCGSPFTNNCTQGGKPSNMNPMTKDKDDEESQVHSWFYMGLGIGFAIGFWGVLGVIFFNKRCRHAYFRFLSLLCEMVLLKMDIVYWNFRNCYNRN